jgi:chorismate synthase
MSRIPTIRPLAGYDEFRACVALQQEVWGRDFSERVPVAILRASQRLGGVVAGSFSEGGELDGFVFGMTGIEEGEPVHWSDMLAVRPGLRGSGLGRQLKLYQRAVLLERGVRKVYWTFDPLESGNAWLNLERLGVVAHEYIEDAYGASDSPLHEGIGTDRLVALWLLDSPRVAERVGERAADRASRRGTEGAARPGSSLEEGTPGAQVHAALEAAGGRRGEGAFPRPGVPRLGLEAARLTVAIPADIQALKERDLELAGEWRVAVRAALVHYLERGWEVRALERAGPVSRYVLVRRDGNGTARGDRPYS